MNFKQNMFDVMKYESFIGHFLPKKLLVIFIFFLITLLYLSRESGTLKKIDQSLAQKSDT